MMKIDGVSALKWGCRVGAVCWFGRSIQVWDRKEKDPLQWVLGVVTVLVALLAQLISKDRSPDEGQGGAAASPPIPSSGVQAASFIQSPAKMFLSKDAFYVFVLGLSVEQDMANPSATAMARFVRSSIFDPRLLGLVRNCMFMSLRFKEKSSWLQLLNNPEKINSALDSYKKAYQNDKLDFFKAAVSFSSEIGVLKQIVNATDDRELLLKFKEEIDREKFLITIATNELTECIDERLKNISE